MTNTSNIQNTEFKIYGTEAKRIADIERRIPSVFADTLAYHMDRLKCTEESLTEKSLILPKTIQRMRNDIRYKAKLETIVAVCIGLQLHPSLSMDLVRKSGHSFIPCCEEHIIYQMLLYEKYKCSIYECNEILKANDFKVLSKEE